MSFASVTTNSFQTTAAHNRGLEIKKGTYLTSLRRSWVPNENIKEITNQLGPKIKSELKAILESQIFRNHRQDYRNRRDYANFKAYKLEISDNKVFIKYGNNKPIPLVVNNENNNITNANSEIDKEALGLIEKAQSIMNKARHFKLNDAAHHSPTARSFTAERGSLSLSASSLTSISSSSNNNFSSRSGQKRDYSNMPPRTRQKNHKKSTEIRDLQKQLHDLSTKKTEVENALKASEKQLNGAKKLLEELGKKQSQHENNSALLNKELADANQNIKKLESEIELAKKQADAAAEKHKNITSELKQKLTAANSQVILVKNDKDDLTKNLSEKLTELSKIQNKITHLNKKIKKISKERATLEAENKKISKDNARLNTIISDQFAALNNNLEQTNELIKLLTKTRLTVDTIKERHSEETIALKEKNSILLGFLKKYQCVLTHLNKTLDSTRNKLRSTKSILKKTEQNLQKINNQFENEKSKLQSEIQSKKSTIKNLESTYSETLKQDQTQLSNLKLELNELNLKLTKLETTHQSRLNELSDKILKSLDKNQDKIKTLQSEHDKKVQTLEAIIIGMGEKNTSLSEQVEAFEQIKSDAKNLINLFKDYLNTYDKITSSLKLELKNKNQHIHEMESKNKNLEEKIIYLNKDFSEKKEKLRKYLNETIAKIKIDVEAAENQNKHEILSLQTMLQKRSTEKRTLEKKIKGLINLFPQAALSATGNNNIEALEALIKSKLENNSTGLEEYQKALEELGKQRDNAEERSKSLTLLLNNKNEELDKIKQELKHKNNEYDDRKKEYEKLTLSLNNKIEKLNKIKDEYENKTKEYERNVTTFEETQKIQSSEIERLKQQLQSSQDQYSSSFQDAQTKISDSHNKELHDLKTKYETKLKSLNATIHDLRGEITKNQSFIEAKNLEIAALTNKELEIQEELKSYKSHLQLVENELEKLNNQFHKLSLKYEKELNTQWGFLTSYKEAINNLNGFQSLKTALENEASNDNLSYLYNNPDTFTEVVQALLFKAGGYGNGTLQDNKAKELRIKELNNLLTKITSIVGQEPNTSQGDNFDSLINTLETLRSKALENNDLKENITNLNSEKQNLSSSLSSNLDELAQLKNNLDQINKERAKVKHELKTLEEKSSKEGLELLAQLQARDFRVSIQDEELNKLKDLLKTSETTLSKKETEIALLQKALKNLVTQHAKELDIKDTACKEKISEENKKWTDSQNQLNEDKEKLEVEISKQNEKLKSQKTIIDDLLEKLKTTEEEQNNARSKIQKLTQLLEDEKNRAKAAAEAKAEIENKEAETAKELITATEVLNEANALAQRQHDTISKQTEEIENLNSKINAVSDENTRLYTQVHNLKKEVLSLNDVKGQILVTKQENTKLKEDLDMAKNTLFSSLEETVTSPEPTTLKGMFEAIKNWKKPISFQISKSVAQALRVNLALTPDNLNITPPIRNINNFSSNNVTPTTYKFTYKDLKNTHTIISSNTYITPSKTFSAEKTDEFRLSESTKRAANLIVTQSKSLFSEASDRSKTANPKEWLALNHSTILEVFDKIKRILPQHLDMSFTPKKISDQDVQTIRSRTEQFLIKCFSSSTEGGIGQPYFIRDLTILLTLYKGKIIDGNRDIKTLMDADSIKEVEDLLKAFTFLLQNMKITELNDDTGNCTVSFFEQYH
jgi:chromosome segregation ATPase